MEILKYNKCRLRQLQNIYFWTNRNLKVWIFAEINGNAHMNSSSFCIVMTSGAQYFSRFKKLLDYRAHY